MSQSNLKSPSPHRNSPDSYESAAKEIEQEKQMVAALKRLSMGHLMDIDPDLPPADPEFHLYLDRDVADDSTFSGDSLSLSKSPLPQTSESNVLLTRKKSDGNRSSPSVSNLEPDLDEPASPDQNIDPDLLWVPANVHPEVNPQLFKHHVKNTIDELLERKLSRSKSASRSKRSSLSLSSTGDVLFSETEDSSKPKDDFETNVNRYSNPSLRELTSELQTMSRLAGMDSNDAVTLARSLSTSSLGYSDVERLAFDELSSPRSSSKANQAELLDFGVEESSPSPRKSYNRMMGQNHHNQHYARESSGLSSREAQPNGHHYPSHPQKLNNSNEDFTLKRSRRLDYRKGPTTSLIGSQLQHSKAEKLAELRHNIASNSLTPTVDRLSVGSSAGSRASMQSINPRSSQILFSYRSPSAAPPVVSKATSSSKSQAAYPAYDMAAKDSPYKGAAPLSPIEQNMHHTKYGHHNYTSKQYSNLKSHRGLRSSLKEYPQQRVSSQGRFLPEQVGSKSRSSSAGSMLSAVDQKRRVSPNTGALVNQSGNSYQYYQQLGSPYQGTAQEQGIQPQYAYRSASQEHGMPKQGRAPSGGRPMQRQGSSQHLTEQSTKTSSQPPFVTYPVQQPIQQQQQQQQYQRQYQQPYESTTPEAPQYAKNRPVRNSSRTEIADLPTMSRSHSYSRDKSEDLNQNLDLLRSEINEFKESLSKTEPKQTPPPVVNEDKEDVTDFSFDITSHDVSYEDSLGIEQEVLKELNTDQGKRVPAKSPSHSPTKSLTRRSSSTKRTSGQAERPAMSKISPTKRREYALQSSHSLVDQADAPKRSASSSPTKRDRQRGSSNPQLDAKVPEVANRHDEDAASEKENISTYSFKIQTSAETRKKRASVPEQTGTISREHSSSDLTALAKSDSQASKHDDIYLEGTGSDLLNELNDDKENEIDLDSHKKEASVSSKIDNDKRKSSKKNWPWSKERSVSTGTSLTVQASQTHSPARSVSSPELSIDKRDSRKNDQAGKENVITKLFKKRRSNSVSSEKANDNGRKASMESSESDSDQRSMVRRKLSQQLTEMEPIQEIGSEVKVKARKTSGGKADEKPAEENKVTRLKNKLKNITKINEEKPDKAEVVEPEPAEAEDQKPQSTLEVQEKLKKSIRRTSKANQPIEFTESTFGFPLPPPSHSTLVMIDYRFPVHVERAIYRLSHLKLANPKRSLREQVLLSNFMYAYLNLVDHTLHLEQQMSLEDQLDQPAQDMDILGDRDSDTEFEAEDDYEEEEFDSIKLDLDVKDTRQITV